MEIALVLLHFLKKRDNDFLFSTASKLTVRPTESLL